MINANELRRGNWILEDGKPIRVDEIRHWYFGDAEPIELSPEILEKAGFVLENETWQDPQSIFSFRPFGLKDNSYNLCYLDKHLVYSIDSVHRLQNIYFALTGKELTINL